MSRDEQVQAEVERVASENQILPEEVQVTDLSGQQSNHVWRHYGLTHICHSPNHPRHVFTSKAV